MPDPDLEFRLVKAVPNLEIYAPFNGGLVSPSFFVDGSYPIDNETITIQAADSTPQNPITFGPFTATVANEAWSVQVNITSNIINPVTLTLTASDNKTDKSTLQVSISSVVDGTGDAGTIEDP